MELLSPDPETALNQLKVYSDEEQSARQAWHEALATRNDAIYEAHGRTITDTTQRFTMERIGLRRGLSRQSLYTAVKHARAVFLARKAG